MHPISMQKSAFYKLSFYWCKYHLYFCFQWFKTAQSRNLNSYHVGVFLENTPVQVNKLAIPGNARSSRMVM